MIDRRVVVDAGRAPLEQRADDARRPPRARPRPAPRVVGPGIGSARSKLAWSSVWQKYWRAEQLRQADELRAVAGGGADALERARQVVGRIGRAAHLDERDLELLGRRHGVTIVAVRDAVNRRLRHATSRSIALPSSRSQTGCARRVEAHGVGQDLRAAIVAVGAADVVGVLADPDARSVSASSSQ